MSKRLLFVAFLFLLYNSSQIALKAQSIQPDRPGFSTGTYTLPTGNVYLEMGYQVSYSSFELSPTIHNFPQSNFRFGLAEHLEANFMWSGFGITHGENRIDAFSSFALGAKLRVVQAERFNISLMGIIASSGELNFNPTLGFLWDYSVIENLDLFGVIHLSYSNEYRVYSEIALGLAYSLTDRFGTFVEYFNSIGLSSSNVLHFGSFGATYLITDDIQFDAFFETEIDRIGYTAFGLGISKRF